MRARARTGAARACGSAALAIVVSVLLAACAKTPLMRPIDIQGPTVAQGALRSEILWALGPYAAAASNCPHHIDAISVAPLATATDAAAQKIVKERWDVQLCGKTTFIYLTVREAAEGSRSFAFDTQP
jgi:hypothetical protein